MPYVRVDDHFPEHPKVLPLPDAARWLYVDALCYAHRNRTDGHVPVEFVGRRRTRQALALVAARLWVRAPDGEGWLINDYLGWNPSRAQLEDATKRMAEGGQRGARKRWGTTDPPQ